MDADRCLSILENVLAKNNQPFLGGEKYGEKKRLDIHGELLKYLDFL